MIYIQTGMHDQMNVTQTITCNVTTLAPPSVWGYFSKYNSDKPSKSAIK